MDGFAAVKEQHRVSRYVDRRRHSAVCFKQNGFKVLISPFTVVLHLLFRFILSHVFVGPLDVHPSQDAIVVHYEVEAIVLNEYGEPAVADRKSAQKV